MKKRISEAEFRIEHYIVGDAHAGNWHWQVSILARESIDVMQEQIPNPVDGAFAENLIPSGLDFSGVTIGDRLLLGHNIVMEITQIGKECHSACAIRSLIGDCIMPRECVFCRVLAGSRLAPGEKVCLVPRGIAMNCSPATGGST